MTKWMLAEDIPDLDFFFSQVFLYSFGNDLKNACGTNYEKILGVYRGKDLLFYYDELDCKRFCQHVLNKIIENPTYGEWINSEIKKRSDELVKQAETAKQDLKKRSNNELWEIYSGHVKAHRYLYEVGWLPNSIDMFYPDFTTYLKNYLREKEKNEEKVNTIFVTLTASEEETIAQQERKDLLSISIKIFNDEFHKQLFTKGLTVQEVRHFISPEFRKMFEEHCEKYKHLKFLYHGVPASVFDYYKECQEILSGEKDLVLELESIDQQLSTTKQAKELLFRELAVDEKHVLLFNLFGKFMASKWHRRNAQILSLFYLEPLLKEIGDRFNKSLWQVRVMQWKEVEEILLQEKKPSNEELNKRLDFFVYYVEEGKSEVFTGEKAFELEKQTESIIDVNVTELHGQTACLGKATGTVKIINRAKDLHKFNQGDILVAIATDPDVVPAMKKAGAIVTEQGGVTSHAAIVSRELGVPCVIGTKIATKVFKDGDIVEVDATKGIVRILERKHF